MESLDNLNIVDVKGELDVLTSKIISKYIQVCSTLADNEKINNNKIEDINNLNTSLSDNLNTKVVTINNLERELQIYKDREAEYINVINLKEEKINNLMNNITVVDCAPENKFDMLRAQAKEISDKDKEIIRLRKELKLSQNISNLTIDTVDTVSNEVPINEVPSTVNENDSSDDNECNVSVIKYRKKEYYIIDGESPQHVYLIEDDDNLGNKIGTWDKQENGKYKLTKF